MQDDAGRAPQGDELPPDRPLDEEDEEDDADSDFHGSEEEQSDGGGSDDEDGKPAKKKKKARASDGKEGAPFDFGIDADEIRDVTEAAKEMYGDDLFGRDGLQGGGHSLSRVEQEEVWQEMLEESALPLSLRALEQTHTSSSAGFKRAAPRVPLHEVDALLLAVNRSRCRAGSGAPASKRARHAAADSALPSSIISATNAAVQKAQDFGAPLLFPAPQAAVGAGTIGPLRGVAEQNSTGCEGRRGRDGDLTLTGNSHNSSCCSGSNGDSHCADIRVAGPVVAAAFRRLLLQSEGSGGAAATAGMAAAPVLESSGSGGPYFVSCNKLDLIRQPKPALSGAALWLPAIRDREGATAAATAGASDTIGSGIGSGNSSSCSPSPPPLSWLRGLEKFMDAAVAASEQQAPQPQQQQQAGYSAVLAALPQQAPDAPPSSTLPAAGLAAAGNSGRFGRSVARLGGGGGPASLQQRLLAAAATARATLAGRTVAVQQTVKFAGQTITVTKLVAAGTQAARDAVAAAAAKAAAAQAAAKAAAAGTAPLPVKGLGGAASGPRRSSRRVAAAPEAGSAAAAPAAAEAEAAGPPAAGRPSGVLLRGAVAGTEGGSGGGGTEALPAAAADAGEAAAAAVGAAGEEEAATAPSAPGGGSSGGLGALVAGLDRTEAISTLAKSSLDWDSYKATTAGVEDELAGAAKEGVGYLGRQGFLGRVDARQEQAAFEKRAIERSRAAAAAASAAGPR